MKVTYGFCLASEIITEEGDWCPLSFERDGNRVTIEKPLPRTQLDWEPDSVEMHSAVPPPPEVFAFQAGGDELAYTLVKVGITPPAEVGVERLHDETRATALVVLQELASWVRVLTRQYWVGRRGRDVKEDKYLLYMGNFGEGLPLHTGGAGRGFDSSRTLDVATWVRVGRVLELGERPSASQLFFCDALLDIAEGNIPQAVAALGVSCDQEVYSLTGEVLAGKGEELRRMYEKFVSLNFQQSLDALALLGCGPFKGFDPEAHARVLKLYKARNKTVHEGKEYYREDGRDITITRTDTPRYVQAVERLFAWADSERTRLAHA